MKLNSIKNDNYDDLDFGQINNNTDSGDDYNYMSSEFMDKHQDLFKDLTSFDPFLRKMIAEWMGMYWNEQQEKYVRDKNIKPIMNAIGARFCINHLRTYTRENNLITQMDEKLFNEMYIDIVDNVYMNLAEKSEEFGFTSNGDIKHVANQLIHAPILVLRGAGGSNNYKKFLGDTNQRNETANMLPGYPQQQQRTGFLGRIKKLLGGGS